jgi:hypothetical protein
MATLASVKFVKSGRGKARCAPNPDYPNGLDIRIKERPACIVDLPYPAPECGHWAIEYRLCGLTVAVTAAGRADDPRSVQVPCQKSGSIAPVQ